MPGWCSKTRSRCSRKPARGCRAGPGAPTRWWPRCAPCTARRGASSTLIARLVEAVPADTPLARLTEAGSELLDHAIYFLPGPEIELPEVEKVLFEIFPARRRRLRHRASPTGRRWPEVAARMAALRATPVPLPQLSLGRPGRTTRPRSAPRSTRPAAVCAENTRQLAALAKETGLAGLLNRVAVLEWLQANAGDIGTTRHMMRITGWTRAADGAEIRAALDAAGIDYALTLGDHAPGDPPMVLDNPRLAQSLRVLPAAARRTRRPRRRPLGAHRHRRAAPVRLHVRRRRPGRGAGRGRAVARRRGSRCSSCWCRAGCDGDGVRCPVRLGVQPRTRDPARSGCTRSTSRSRCSRPRSVLGVVLLIARHRARFRPGALAPARRLTGSASSAASRLPISGCSRAWFVPALAWALPVGLGLTLALARDDAPAGRPPPPARPLAEFVEAMMRLLVSTVSFSRVGAFALAHAGLSAAIVGVAEALGGVGFWIALLIGNVADPRARGAGHRHPDHPPDPVRILHPVLPGRGA